MLPPAIAAALESGATTFCHCWLLTRRDGVELGLTDHDCDLAIGARLFEAASGFTASAMESEAGFSTGGGEIAGALSSERITAEDIAAGLYDGAQVRTFLVDWQNPALDFSLATMTLGDIRRADGRFIAETRDAFHALDQERGRLYALACDAEFGDARCGMNRNAAPHRVNGAIAAFRAPAILVCAAAASAEAGLFSRGTVTFTSGANAGAVATIKEHRGDGEILLWQAPGAPVLAGDTVEITAGCDKRFQTCRDRFNNALNFRGFPFIPAPEAVLAYARPGEGRHRGRPLVR